jgi:hypothetical protein
MLSFKDRGLCLPHLPPGGPTTGKENMVNCTVLKTFHQVEVTPLLTFS